MIFLTVHCIEVKVADDFSPTCYKFFAQLKNRLIQKIINSNELFKNKIETRKKEIKNVVSNQLSASNKNNEIFNIKRKSNIDINDNKVRSKLNTNNPNNYELKHISKPSRNINQSKPKYRGTP